MTYTAKAYFRHGHGEAPVMIETVDDVDALVEALAADPFNSVAAVYVDQRTLTEQGFPDHSLRIAVYGEGKVGGLRYTSGMESWYAVGVESRRDEGALYNHMENLEGFPLDSELELDVLVAAAKQFLMSGGERPDGVEWAVWPADQV